MRIVTLLSPAKTLNWAPSPASLSEIWTQPKLLPEADPVLEVMQRKSTATLKKLMSVSDNIADLNHERFKIFLGSNDVEEGMAEHKSDNFRPAAMAYDGPAYRGLDANTFSEDDWEFSKGSIRLLSGMYGVLLPTDVIQPYRLEMGSRVGISGKKDLYEYWKEDITESLIFDMSGSLQKSSSSPERSGDSPVPTFLVVNVASQEYSKAVDFEKLKEAGGKVITCTFKDDGRVLSVFAKRARGLFARHVVTSRAKCIEDLEAFSSEGYCLDRSQCGDDLLTFGRSKSQRVPPQPKASASKTQTARKKRRTASAPEPEKKIITGAERKKPLPRRKTRGKDKP